MLNRELYDKYDMPGKVALMKILTHFGHTLVGSIHDEHYSETDIITENVHKQQTKWEIQVRTQDNYNKIRNKTFSTFFVHTRKNQNNSDYYVVFPENYKEVAITKMSHVKQSPIKTVRTKSGTYESFFDVPIKHVTFYKITDNFEIMNCELLESMR